jgi:hypothetical protein
MNTKISLQVKDNKPSIKFTPEVNQKNFVL